MANCYQGRIEIKNIWFKFFDYAFTESIQFMLKMILKVRYTPCSYQHFRLIIYAVLFSVFSIYF